MLNNYVLSATPDVTRALDDLIAERDALQARIDAYEGRLEEWEEIDRLIAASSLGGEEAQRVRDSVPPQVGKLIVRAAQEAERAERAEQERDRLREWIAEAANATEATVFEVLAERERLRAVVAAAQAVLAAIDSTVPGRLFAGIEGRHEVALLRQRLDGSPDIGERATSDE